jgi:hypothetical protein
VRLSDETWTAIRLASVRGSVSSASLMESLASLWITAHESAEPWANSVMERAQVIQREVNRARTLKNRVIRPKTPENGAER